ncbi:beta-lactamase-like protein [Pilobolus umbonatus]|nr:beta-lactamase-like protein [Pilobolus umbonatus]
MIIQCVVRSFLLKRPRLIQYSGMKTFFQIVGDSTPEGPPSVIATYGQERIVFNCREGFQRLCTQEKVRLNKISNVFLTRLTWDNHGGLAGLLLTLSDVGTRNLHIHGGKNLTHFIAATRHFVYRTSTTLNVHEYISNPPPVVQNGFTVTPVLIQRDQTPHPLVGTKREYQHINSDSEEESPETHNGEDANDYRRNVINSMFSDASNGSFPPGHTIEADCTPRNGGEQVHPLNTSKRTKRNQIQQQYLSKALPRTSSDSAAICYISQCADIPGKFNKDIAMSLGLKPGPVYGKLKNGMSVTMDDGKVITKDMVCDPDTPGEVFMVIDCPSTAYIESLIQSEQFKPFQQGGQHKTQALVHLSDIGVLNDARYKEWMNSFGPDTDHIIGAKELCPQSVQYTSHALIQYKLSKLDDTIFPIPKYNNTPELTLSQIPGLPENSHPLQNMLEYEFRPKKGVKYMDRPPFDVNNKELEDIKVIDENTEYMELVKLAKVDASKVNISESFPGDNLEIITLGTGSSVPGKYRNVSATLVKIPDYGSVLLDAGEGTYGQMIRLFGDNADKELAQIKCVFVSHLHADHHLGVVHILSKWNKLNVSHKKSMVVVAPFVYRTWLKEYRDVEYIGPKHTIKFIPNESTLIDREPRYQAMNDLEELKSSLGLSSIQAIEVEHCRWAYGLSIEHKLGWKLVYSGDTRPCNALVDQGKDATILIHEASLEDEHKEKAIEKRHSTTSEAIGVGQRMNARYILLNHFSQRYPKVPVMKEDYPNAWFSFDMMTVPLKQFPILPTFTKAVRVVFKDVEGDEDVAMET